MEAHRQDFEKVFQDHLSEVERLISMHTRNAEDKLDLTQEVFIRAYSAFSQFRGDSNISTWLHRIAINVCANAARTKSRHPEETGTEWDLLECPSGLSDVIEELARAEEQRVLKKALRSLTAQQLLILSLRFSDQLTLPEIAGVVGAPVDTIKSRLRAALSKIESAVQYMQLTGIAGENSSCIPQEMDMSLENLTIQGENGAKVYHNLGSLYLRKGLIEAALSEWRRAQVVDPTFVDAYMASAQEYIKMSEPHKAVDTLESAVSKIQNADLHSTLANVYLDIGDIDQGLIHSGKAVDLKPESAQAHYVAGRAFYKQAEIQDALRSLNRKASATGEPTVELSWKKSAIHCSQALDLEPEFAKARSSLAVTYLQDNMREEAIQETEKAVSLKTADDMVFHQAGWVNFKIGKLQAAENYLKHAVIIKPSGDKKCLLGDVCLALGKHEEAYITYKEALTLTLDKRSQARIYTRLAATALRLHKLIEASEAAEKALELHPTHITARCNLAESYLARGVNTEKVVELCREGLEIAPDHICFHRMLAEGLLYLGKYGEALPEANTAIELEPEDCDRWIVRARILTNLGRFEEARTDLVKAIEMDLRSQNAVTALNDLSLKTQQV